MGKRKPKPKPKKKPLPVGKLPPVTDEQIKKFKERHGLLG